MKENKVHELKTWCEYFKEIKSGNKTFEVRKNDRNFQVGDILLLKEWEPKGYNSVSPSELTGEYTGNELSVEVTYVLRVKPEDAALFGISSETVVMGIKLLKENKALNEAAEIVKELAQWSLRYPRGMTYSSSRQPQMDGELIALEEKAKKWFDESAQYNSVDGLTYKQIKNIAECAFNSATQIEGSEGFEAWWNVELYMNDRLNKLNNQNKQ